MKTYRSRMEWWLAAFLFLPAVGGLVALAAALIDGTASMLWLAGGGLLFHLLIRWSLHLPIAYSLGEDGLRIRDAHMRLHIPFERLIAAELSSDPGSAPALSLARIEVVYRESNDRRRLVLISPPDRERFLADLVAASNRHRLVQGKVVEAHDD